MLPLFEDLVLSPLLLFGLCLLGGLASGELSRRLFNLPRTTGYVLCGLVLGQSGLGWIDPYVLGSAQFFIYPALGLILFELGQRVPFDGGRIDPQLITLGLIESAAVFVLVLIVMLGLGFGGAGGAFAAAIAVSTSCLLYTSSAVGYQPTLAAEMGALQERITSTRKGSITSMQAIYVPADDYSDPAPVATFAHLDAIITLERSVFARGIFPAVDPLALSLIHI